MKICKNVVFGIFACALVFGAAGVKALPPPPPPGMQLMPGMAWCSRCGGHGRVPSGFLGMNEKRCPECKGHRMVRLRPLPQPPPPVHHHHHAQPVPPPPAHPVRPQPVPPPRGPVYR